MAHRVVFFGTAELACASLERLAADPRFNLLAAVTQPDKPRGRDLRLQPSPVKAAALARGIPVLQPVKARDAAFLEQLRQLAPAFIVVAAYGQILPPALLELPPHGCLNVHTSLLPRHRGAAPIQWAILSGDAETGATIMKMDAGLDTGPILSMARTPITPEDNAQTLHDRLARLGADLLLETIPSYLAGEIEPRAQSEGATYARKISKEDGLIDWKRSATEIWNQVRAFTPWPGAFTHWNPGGNRRLLKIWEARPLPEFSPEQPGTLITAGRLGLKITCGQGVLLVSVLQLEGGRRLTAAEFLAGHKAAAGHRFGILPDESIRSGIR